MRSSLTEKIQRANTLVEQIHALPEDERNYLLDLLLPETEPKPKVKRKRKAGTTASPRRRGLSEQVKAASGTANLCVAMIGTVPCSLPADNPIHDPKGGYAGYHAFVPARAASASGD